MNNYLSRYAELRKRGPLGNRDLDGNKVGAWNYRGRMEKRSHDKRIEGFVLNHEQLFEQVRAELRKRGPLGNRDLDGNKVGAWNYRGRMEKRSHDKRIEGFVLNHEQLFEQVRAELRKRGPLGNRDLDGNKVGAWNYRGRMEKRSHDKRIEGFVLNHEQLFEQVRAELRKRGPLGNRDLDGNKVGAWNYRGRKDTSLVLFDMWLSGELMMHHRNGFDRVYDFRENIAPREYD